MNRPSESITAIVGSVVGAILILVSAIWDVEVGAEVSGAIVVLVSWTAALVTWFVAKRQRSGDLGSAVDGTVKPTA